MKLINEGANQTTLTFNGTGKWINGEIFFSYETPVAAEINGIVYKTDKKWSMTTTKHINRWLNGREAKDMGQEWFNNLIEGIKA